MSETSSAPTTCSPVQPRTRESDVVVSESSSDASSSHHVSTTSSTTKRKTHRKAPGAPKRFKSPYILFSIDRMQQYVKDKESTTTVTSISSRVSREWKALSKDERLVWQKQAQLDKERYEAEKSLYTGPWQIPNTNKRSKKDPTAPKRPMSAFLLYSQTKRRILKEQHPSLKNTEISKLLGRLWQQASGEERQPHVDREQRERTIYNQRITKWRTEKQQAELALREHRKSVAEQWIVTQQQSGFPQQIMMTTTTTIPVAYAPLPTAVGGGGVLPRVPATRTPGIVATSVLPSQQPQFYPILSPPAATTTLPLMAPAAYNFTPVPTAPAATLVLPAPQQQQQQILASMMRPVVVTDGSTTTNSSSPISMTPSPPVVMTKDASAVTSQQQPQPMYAFVPQPASIARPTDGNGGGGGVIVHQQPILYYSPPPSHVPQHYMP